MCASPERFVKKYGRKVISQPIKGTIRRGCDIYEDKKLIEKLSKSKKDIAENIMITDLVRNDLSITAEKGSVHVEELCKVYTFDKIHQMISTISAQVEKEIHCIDLIKSITKLIQ